MKRKKGSPSVFMYHMDCPKGQLFKPAQVDQLVQAGWVDTPAKLDLPVQETKPPPELSQEQIERARPGDLVGLVKGMGYKVMTPIEYEAMTHKAQAGNNSGFALADYTNAEIIAEAEKRGLKEQDPHVQAEEGPEQGTGTLGQLAEQFKADPHSLVVDELVLLGNQQYGLDLKDSLQAKTLISRISKAQIRSEAKR